MTYDFINPPLQTAVPPGAEALAVAALAGALLALTLFVLLRARSGARGVAALCIAGGALAVVFDAQLSVLTLRWFPTSGAATLYTSSGRAVPMYWLLFQAAFVGAGIAWLITARRSAFATPEALWNSVWMLALLRWLFEIGGVRLGLWSYYGWQPFSVFGVPLWMPILSAVAVVAAARFVQFSLTNHHPSTLLVGVPLSYSIAIAMQVWPLILSLNHRESNVIWSSAAMVLCVLLAGIFIEALRRLPAADAISRPA